MPESPLPRVRVVVLNWNSAWFTRRCLRALESTDYPVDRLEVVLVDNASIDGSLEQMRHSFPDLRIVRNAANLGFAEGCNRAMRDRVGVDAVALVNNDAVPDPDWLRPLVEGLSTDPRAGAVAARLVLEPAFTRLDLEVRGGSVELTSVRVDDLDVLDRVRMSGVRSVGRVEWPMELDHHVDDRATLQLPAGDGPRTITLSVRGTGSVVARTDEEQVEAELGGGPAELRLRAGADRSELLNGLGTELGPDGEGVDRLFGEPVDRLDGVGPEVVPGFCGGGVLLRSEMLDQVGLFDPAFFAYYEDTDLSWRARNAGWHTITAPDSVIRHAFGGSAGSKARGFFFLNYRNWLMTVLRNGDAAQRRRSARSAWARIRWAVRANLLSPLKHRRRPDTLLVRAWGRVLLGTVAELPHVRRSRVLGCVGAHPTDQVRSRLQPSPAPRPPGSRPGGPLVVYLDVTDALRAPSELTGRLTAELVRALPDADPRIDLVALVVAGTGTGRRRATPTEYGRLLGVDGRHVQVDPTLLGLDEFTPSSATLHIALERDSRSPSTWRVSASPAGVAAGGPDEVELASGESDGAYEAGAADLIEGISSPSALASRLLDAFGRP